jgi:phosphoribosylanthranilate isomerase
MTRIKICGIMRAEDAAAAVEAGANAVGFVFVPSSPRFVTFEAAARIIRTLPPFVTPVGVFLRPLPVDIRRAFSISGIALAQVLDARDLDATDLPIPIFHAVRVGADFDHEALRSWGMRDFLLDTKVDGMEGGSGRTFDWGIAAKAGEYARIILAGGLTPENVGEAIATAWPYAVDVSSGVEVAPGIKSAAKIQEFVKAVREAEKGPF